MLRSRRRLVLICVVVAAAVAFAYSMTKTPVYEASATLDFDDPGRQPGQILGNAQPNFFPQEDSAAGVAIITRPDVIEAVSEATGVPPDDVKDSVTTEVDAASNLVTVTVSDEDAKEAERIANQFARQVRLITRNDAREFFQTRADALGDTKADRDVASRLEQLAAVADPVSIVRPAEEPESPSSPKPARDTIIAAILGLLIGVGAAFLRHSLDRRVKDAHDLQRELGLPLVGYVRTESLGMAITENGAPAVSEDDLEAFRILRTNVDFLAKDQTLKSVAVTSALPEEGKSTVAAWYAYANAVAGRRTILVECDFRRPVMAQRFDLNPSPGLSDYLVGEVQPKDVLRSIPVKGPKAEHLPIVPAGVDVFQPAELIASDQFAAFFEQIQRAYELVVIDCAPLLPVGDTLELLPQVGGVLLCVRLGQTTHDQARAAKEAMAHLPERPTGLVVTGLERGSEDDYYGYYSAYPSSKQHAESVS